MYKMRISPETTGYSVEAGETVLAVQLAGGAPRVRLDQLGAVYKVDVQWTVGPSDFNYLAAFYRAGTVMGSLPFQIDLVGVESSTVTTYTAIVVPNTWKLLSQGGLTYVVGCSLWAIPTIDESISACADKALLIALATTSGQSVAWAFATAVSDTGSNGNGWIANEMLCSGDIYQIHGEGLSQNTFGIKWSSFTLPTLPVGATVVSILPVIVASDVSPQATLVQGVYGYNLNWAVAGVSGTTNPLFANNDLSATSTTFEGASVGTTSADLANLDMIAYVTTTLGVAINEHLHIDFAALAVVYE